MVSAASGGRGKYYPAARRGPNITPTVVGVYRDWPGSSALNLYI